MSATRYEILLPLKYNEGGEIEPEKLLQTKQELIQRFGALTVNPHPIEGVWSRHGGAYVDVEADTPQVQAFFREFKEVLKERFKQLDIWIVAYPIRLV